MVGACAALLACGVVRDRAANAEAAARTRADTPQARPRASLEPGVQVLMRDSFALISGRRLGLITNQTGFGELVRADGSTEIATSAMIVSSRPEARLVALFSPEHGFTGAARPGERVASGYDSVTGVPIYSLYGITNAPTPETLAGIDALLFDIQDVGARYYTYVWTMALSMKAAGKAGIPFIVLDRPNPIGGVLVQGNVLDAKFASFIGLYPVPMRHGLTAAELARLLVGELGVQVELHVVPMDGWRRELSYDQLALPWVPPSPNMPSPATALSYPGTCLFEGTSLSVGRGTDAPFQQIGAPWLNADTLAARLNAYGLPGVRFEPATFTPVAPGDGKWPEAQVHGVRFVVTDRSTYDPTRAAVAALIEAKQRSGARWQWILPHFDQLAGTDALRRAIDAGRTLDEATAGWPAQLAAFAKLRDRYLIYR